MYIYKIPFVFYIPLALDFLTVTITQIITNVIKLILLVEIMFVASFCFS